MSLRDQILAADDLDVVEVPAPEWGLESVRVSVMTGTARDRFDASLVKRVDGKIEQDLANFKIKLLACCIVDDEGEPVFEPEDVPALGRKSAAVLDRLVAVAEKINGMRTDFEGNFEPSPGGDSASS